MALQGVKQYFKNETNFVIQSDSQDKMKVSKKK